MVEEGLARTKTLIVFYSRTGATRSVAHALARAIPCDVEEIGDTRNRAGVLGYLASAVDGSCGRCTALRPTRLDPAAYDVVIVGTPIWYFSLSAPVRTYLRAYGPRLKAVAFFCTCGGKGRARVFGQMRDVCGHEPLATLAVKRRELTSDSLPARIADFVETLRGRWAVGDSPEPATD